MQCILIKYNLRGTVILQALDKSDSFIRQRLRWRSNNFLEYNLTTSYLGAIHACADAAIDSDKAPEKKIIMIK